MATLTVKKLIQGASYEAGSKMQIAFMRIRLAVNLAFARLRQAAGFLVGIQEGEGCWESEQAHFLIAQAATAAERIQAVETCILHGVPLDYCFTLCRIAPRLADDFERAKFIAWLGVVADQRLKAEW